MQRVFAIGVLDCPRFGGKMTVLPTIAPRRRPGHVLSRHFLAGLREPRELLSWPRRGQSFEGLAIEELAGLAAERAVRPELFFWRTSAGAEVDLLIRDGRRLVPIEIKLGAAVDRHKVAGLRQCMTDLGLTKGYVIANTKERYLIGADIEVVPWTEVVQRQVDFGLGARRGR